jgi:hypothetical protein
MSCTFHFVPGITGASFENEQGARATMVVRMKRAEVFKIKQLGVGAGQEHHE